MKVIVYEKDGSLHRIIPATNIPVEFCLKDIPDGIDYKILENDDMPEGNREAWVLDGDSVVIDESKIVETGE